MAAIDVYLQQILDAIYGEEVRGSIHDSIAAMNVESSTAQSAAISARDSAKVSASVAEAAAEAAAKYARDAERYAGGGLVFQETILFANLPTSGMKQGWMYNIKDDFTTDDRFEEGAGVPVKAGTDVAWTVNGKWDVLATGGSVDANDVLHKDGSIPADYLTIGTRKLDDVIGLPSLTLGENNIGSGKSSAVIGTGSEASGSNSIAIGYGSRSTGNRSIAIGVASIASGTNAIAYGLAAKINGTKTITGINGGKVWTPDLSYTTSLNGSIAHQQVLIFNDTYYSIDKFENGVLTLREELLDETQEEGAEVTLTVYATGGAMATGSGSHAEGCYTKATGSYSHAEGVSTSASAQGSHSEGLYTISAYSGQHVSGKYNSNKSDTLFEVGNGTSTSARANAFEVTSDGYIRTKGQTTKIAFGVDADGNYGYFKDGADTVTPFKTGGSDINTQVKTAQVSPQANWSGTYTNSVTINPDSGYDAMTQVNVSVPMLRDYTLFTVSQTETPSTVYNGNTSQTNTEKMLRIKPTKDGMSYTNSYLSLGASSYMGDATAADVRSGKTFSSSAGIQVTGTATIGGTYQTKTVTPTTSSQTITPDSSYDALSQVTVNAIQTETKTITPSTTSKTATPTSGKYFSSVTVSAISVEARTVKSSTSSQTIYPTSGKYISQITVQACSLQSKTVAATTSRQIITADSDYYGLASVTINAYSIINTSFVSRTITTSPVSINVGFGIRTIIVVANTTATTAAARIKIDGSVSNNWTQVTTTMSWIAFETLIIIEEGSEVLTEPKTSITLQTTSGTYGVSVILSPYVMSY